MPGRVDIVNMALTRLGERQIAALTEDTELADLCEVNYLPVLDELLCSHDWSFASRKATLARLAAAPANEWSYAYQLPADRIGPPLRLFDSAGTGIDPISDYETVGGDQIHTDAEAVVAEYPFRPDESMFPGYFVSAFADKLAEVLAMPITHSEAVLRARAELAARSISQAKSRDDRLDRPRRFVNDALTRARRTG